MSKNPPNCFICGKNCEDKLDRTFYCICDTAICDMCINSIKKNDTTWICPNCKEERNLEESTLFRD
ncbi:MAG: hypothetical protein ACTSO8_04330 [Promethearchaeota archaeon]